MSSTSPNPNPGCPSSRKACCKACRKGMETMETDLVFIKKSLLTTPVSGRRRRSKRWWRCKWKCEHRWTPVDSGCIRWAFRVAPSNSRKKNIRDTRHQNHQAKSNSPQIWSQEELMNSEKTAKHIIRKKDYSQSTVTFEFNLQFMIVKWSCWNLAISPNVSIFYMTFNSVIHMPRKFTSHSLPRGQAKVMDVEVQRTHQDFPHTKTGSWQDPSSEVGLNEL